METETGMQPHQSANFLRERQERLRGASENERRIAERITTLLSHFWTADEDTLIREAQISDWIDALSKFSVSVVHAAAAEYLRTQQKRPTVAAIYALCREMTPPSHPLLAIEGQTNSRSSPVELRDYVTDRNRRWREAAEARQRWATHDA